MKAWFSQKFIKWNDLLSKCQMCGGETESVDRAYLDHILCEFAVRCKKCNRLVAYWAYGNWDGPTTKTDALWFKIYFLKRKIKNLLRLK